MNWSTFREGVFATCVALAIALLVVFTARGCDCGGCGDAGDPDHLSAEETPAESADKAVRSPGGKLVRVVGDVQFDKDADPTASDLGDVVEVQPGDVPGDALCNVVFDARPVAVKVLYPDAEYVGNVPDIPELADEFLAAGCWPVVIQESCTGVPTSTCLWNTQLKGTACTKAADLPQYVGSTAREFDSLPFAVRQRLLRTRGRCGKDGVVPCMVPVGDPRALAGARIYVPHGWSRRRDLNYVGRTGDEYEDRKAK